MKTVLKFVIDEKVMKKVNKALKANGMTFEDFIKGIKDNSPIIVMNFNNSREDKELVSSRDNVSIVDPVESIRNAVACDIEDLAFAMQNEFGA